MSSVRGYDNLYNNSVNDIALLNYNRGIANRLRLQETQMNNFLPFKEPQMLGGVRYSNTILAGTSADGPATLAVGGKAFRKFTGNETALEGGKANINKAYKWLDFSKKVIDDGLGIYDKVKSKGAGRKPKVPKVARIVGGKASIDDAYKWLKFGKDVAGDAVDIFDKVKSRGMGRKPKTVGGNKVKDAYAWLDFGKKVVDDGLGIYDKVKGRGGMVYSQELKDALGGCGDCTGGKRIRKSKVGGAKTSGKFVKGSQEAKDHMARIRAMRKK